MTPREMAEAWRRVTLSASPLGASVPESLVDGVLDHWRRVVSATSSGQRRGRETDVRPATRTSGGI